MIASGHRLNLPQSCSSVLGRRQAPTFTTEPGWPYHLVYLLYDGPTPLASHTFCKCVRRYAIMKQSTHVNRRASTARLPNASLFHIVSERKHDFSRQDLSKLSWSPQIPAWQSRHRVSPLASPSRSRNQSQSPRACVLQDLVSSSTHTRPYRGQNSPNCAVRLPSIVVLVQLSGQVTSRYLPSAIIGSIVNVMPGLHSPTALFLA